MSFTPSFINVFAEKVLPPTSPSWHTSFERNATDCFTNQNARALSIRCSRPISLVSSSLNTKQKIIDEYTQYTYIQYRAPAVNITISTQAEFSYFAPRGFVQKLNPAKTARVISSFSVDISLLCGFPITLLS